MNKVQGFTLIEMMVTVALLGVLLSLAVGGLTTYMDKRQVVSAGEAVYSQLQYARSEAIARSEMVYTKFSSSGSTTWAVGVSTTTGCNPTETSATAANACTLVIDDGDGNVHGRNGVTDTDDLVLKVLRSSDFNNIRVGATTFSGGETGFNPVRGTAGAGTVRVWNDAGYELQVVVSLLGRIRLCSPSSAYIGGYPTCP